MLFVALKTKSCLSDSEFFLFSGEKYWSSLKSAAGEFSLFRFFCSCKRNDELLRTLSEKKPCGLSEIITKSIVLIFSFIKFLLYNDKRKVTLHDFSKVAQLNLTKRNFFR